MGLPNSILQGSMVVLITAFVLHIPIASIYHIFSHDQGPEHATTLLQRKDVC